MYEIELTKSAKKQFLKLDIEIQKRIASSLKRIRIRPHSFVKKLVGNPYYRLRVGDFRIILDIKNNKLLILVLEINHRKNIYK